MGKGGIFGVRQVLHAEVFFRLGNAPGGEGHGPGLLVHKVVAVVVVVNLFFVGFGEYLAAQGGNKVVRHFVQLARILPPAGDNEGGSGLVNQDGVHLVHDGKGMAPLDKLGLVDGHVVAQVVEAQLIVGAVGDVGCVGLPPLGALHAGDNQAHRQAHVPVDLAHPLGVTLGQVLVDGDHMDTLAGEGVQVAGQDGHQGFAFTGFHLGDAALVQHNAA